jgi:hypothetical protein
MGESDDLFHPEIGSDKDSEAVAAPRIELAGSVLAASAESV